MLKFLSIATLVGAALVLSSADASASFFRKKKKGVTAVAAPCCETGLVGYQAAGVQNAPYLATAPVVPTTMPSAVTATVPIGAVQPMPSTTEVVPGSYTQSAFGTSGIVPTGYAVPMANTGKSGKRRFRR